MQGLMQSVVLADSRQSLLNVQSTIDVSPFAVWLLACSTHNSSSYV